METAFAGRPFGVFLVLMAILGGKGSFWWPVIGAIVFHLFNDGFWTFFLGWLSITFRALIIVLLIFFPAVCMSWLR